MSEPRVETQVASDGYAIHVAVWPASAPMRGRVVVLHGIQSHGGWYHGLGRTLAEAGYEAHFPDRRGSGANRTDRGHAPSAGRLLKDIAEWLKGLRDRDPASPIALAGISWGGKLAVVTAGRQPTLVDSLALICPGIFPQLGPSLGDKMAIGLAAIASRRKTFPIPLSDPALFTANPEGQEFIATDRLGLHAATAGLMAASVWIDRLVRKAPPEVRQRALLMLAGQDQIINNALTLGYFETLASTDRHLIVYPEAHHTLEFEVDPTRYALDLVEWLEVDPRQRPGASD